MAEEAVLLGGTGVPPFGARPPTRSPERVTELDVENGKEAEEEEDDDEPRRDSGEGRGGDKRACSAERRMGDIGKGGESKYPAALLESEWTRLALPEE